MRKRTIVTVAATIAAVAAMGEECRAGYEPPDMSIGVLSLVLAAAFAHAGWNFLAKGAEGGAAFVVEALDERRVVGVRLQGRDLHRVVALPEAVGVAERGEPALGRDPGSGQHDDTHGPVLAPTTRWGARGMRTGADSGRQTP